MTKPQTITIDDVEYIRKDSRQSVPQPEGEFVIVRCCNAGVHAGYLSHRDAQTLTLTNSRRLWRWWSEFTLSALANEGPHKDHLADNKYAQTVAKIDLTCSDVAEVIYCTKEARQAIQDIPNYAE